MRPPATVVWAPPTADNAGRGGVEMATRGMLNTQCGGMGPMGCNAEHPVRGHGAGLWGATPNTQCGGMGPMGCNAEHPVRGHGAYGVQRRTPSAGAWGLWGATQNTQCGGMGPMGCNAERPPDGAGTCAPTAVGRGGGVVSLPATMQLPPVGQVAVCCMHLQGKCRFGPACRHDHGADGDWMAGDRWKCACGFKNRMTNDVCGGNGNMGCKAPRSGVGAVTAGLR
eukprot:gene41463-22095_t